MKLGLGCRLLPFLDLGVWDSDRMSFLSLRSEVNHYEAASKLCSCDWCYSACLFGNDLFLKRSHTNSASADLLTEVEQTLATRLPPRQGTRYTPLLFAASGLRR